MVNHAHWIALAQVKGLSRIKKHRILDRLGGISGLIETLEQGKVRFPELDQIRKGWDMDAATQELEKLKRAGAWLLTFDSPQYPPLLKEVADPPLVLFGQGVLPSFQKKWFAVVGTRRPSPYGKRIVKMLSRDLSREGLVVVSGLARGIDTLAHQVCVGLDNPTVAVLGNGLGKHYPPENRNLSSQIQRSGAVLTEYFFDQGPQKHHFPERNRIISGLCEGVLVIEGAERSGAELTAKLALDQNRDVYAVPGPIDEITSFAPNRLISEGAKMVRSSDDILEDLVGRVLLSKAAPSTTIDQESHALTPAEAKILQALEKNRGRSPEDIAKQTQNDIPDVLSALSTLELAGLVIHQGDGTFTK